MRPENYTERKKMMLRFGTLYAGALILVILIFALKGGQQETTGSGWISAEEGSGRRINEWLDRANAPLLQHMIRLKRLDSSYASLMTDSAGKAILPATEKMIQAEEMAFGNSIDGLERQGEEYIGLVAAYRALLEDRHSLLHWGAARVVAGKTGGDDQATELSRLKEELRRKDLYIAGLEEGVKALPGNRTSSASARTLVDLKAANGALSADLEEQRKTILGLKEMTTSLRRSNEALNNRLNPSDRPDGGGGETGSPQNGRAVEAEQRLTELSAELELERVDCNLSRADGRQTIYSSRQRKDLLANALATLTSLSRSNDPAVQKKAKEKLALLRSIASTVHD